jgi:hypothetical protein
VTLEELADIEAIRRLTHDYGFAFDTRDDDGYARCFTEDHILDSTSADPNVPPAKDRKAIVGLLRATAEQQIGGSGGRGSMHQQLNHRIEVDGDRATGTVYFVALGQLKAGNRYEWDGYYKDEYVRTPEGGSSRPVSSTPSCRSTARTPKVPARGREAIAKASPRDFRTTDRRPGIDGPAAQPPDRARRDPPTGTVSMVALGQLKAGNRYGGTATATMSTAYSEGGSDWVF